MNLRHCLTKLIKPKGVTPLPWTVLATLLFVMTLDKMVVTMVFSFLPKLVKSFGTSEADTGYQVGIIASALSIGQTFFSLLWGYSADVKGKKLTMIVSTASLMFSTLAFGFAYNFQWAVTTRFLQGASTALVVISKSIMADLSDDTNMPLAMSILSSSSAVGLIIGPSVAGFVAFPSEQYPDVFSEDSIFGRFGILLPNLILAIACAINAIMIVLFLPKSFKPIKRSRSQIFDIEYRKIFDRAICLRVDDIKNDKVMQHITERTPLLQSSTQEHKDTLRTSEHSINSRNTLKCASFSSSTKESVQKRSWQEWFAKIKTYKLIKLLCIKDCVQASFVYCFYGIATFANLELFPLYAATSAEYHGMSLSTSEIGLVLLIVAAFFLPFQFLVTPRIIRRYGPRKVFMGIHLLLAFVCPWTPILVEIISNRTGLWIAVAFVLFLQHTCMSTGFVAINILINNTVPPDSFGSANGFSMIFLSVGRIIAPIAIGSIYSWSLTNIKDVSLNTDPIGFPCNHYFSFFVLSLLFTSNGIFASTLSPALNKKRVIQLESDPEQDCSMIHT